MTGSDLFDARQVVAARRAGEFAARSGIPITDCPHVGNTAAATVLRRIWVSAYLHTAAPAAGTVDHDDGEHR